MIKVLLLEEDSDQRIQALDCIFEYDPDAIVNCIDTGEKAKELLQKNRYDIVLIHFDAPGVCENELWKWMYGSPVMIFTSTPTVETELFSFQHGAAEYMVRPYNKKVAIARGERLLKKNGKQFGKLKINYYNNTVFLSEKEVLLTATEQKFLFELSRNEDGMTFKDLSKFVWGYDEPDMNSMRVLVSKLNKKLNGAIENIRDWGYRIKKVGES